MTLIKWTGHDLWEPFQEMEKLHETADRLFNLGLLPRPRVTGDGMEWLPDMDLIDEKDKVLIRADLPGMKQEEIGVEITDDLVTIKGERKQEVEKKEGQHYRMERRYGNFLRSFSLPSSVNATKAIATYKNGVLEIALPKYEETKTRQIKVDVK